MRVYKIGTSATFPKMGYHLQFHVYEKPPSPYYYRGPVSDGVQ
jgi:hypothetical protein